MISWNHGKAGCRDMLYCAQAAGVSVGPER
jgi:hypothetical protein